MLRGSVRACSRKKLLKLCCLGCQDIAPHTAPKISCMTQVARQGCRACEWYLASRGLTSRRRPFLGISRVQAMFDGACGRYFLSALCGWAGEFIEVRTYGDSWHLALPSAPQLRTVSGCARARLIGTAPRLYDVLQHVLYKSRNGTDLDPSMSAAE